MTGFRRNIAISQMSRVACDIQRGGNSMYIYFNMCNENVLVDTNVPLLQIVHICGHHVDYVCERYNTPIYIPVQQNNISDIEIPFHAVKTIVTYHP